MKFKATVESGTKEHEVEFDIDDEATAQARLTEAVSKIQQKFLKKAERAIQRASEAPRTSPPPANPTGGAK